MKKVHLKEPFTWVTPCKCMCFCPYVHVCKRESDSNMVCNCMICAMFPVIAGMFCIGAGVCELDLGCMWVVEYFCCC